MPSDMQLKAGLCVRESRVTIGPNSFDERLEEINVFQRIGVERVRLVLGSHFDGCLPSSSSSNYGNASEIFHGAW
jgi:hypothetical protein